MAEIVKIKKLSLSRLTNPLHLNFHQRVHERVSLLAKPDEHKITNPMASYGNCIDDEGERTYETTAAISTEDLNENDVVRDRLVIYLFRVIETAEWSPVEETARASKALQTIISPYKGIQNAADDKETPLIGAMLHDLRKDEYSEYVATLNLNDTLDALEAANNAYKQMKEQRSDEYTNKKKIESAEMLRRRTDEAYELVCDLLYANQLLLPEGTSLVALNKVAQEINTIIDETNASYNRSKAHKDSSKEEDDDKEILPEEKPEDPDKDKDEDTGSGFEPIPVEK